MGNSCVLGGWGVGVSGVVDEEEVWFVGLKGS